MNRATTLPTFLALGAALAGASLFATIASQPAAAKDVPPVVPAHVVAAQVELVSEIEGNQCFRLFRMWSDGTFESREITYDTERGLCNLREDSGWCELP